jgi:hypothetical protein
MEFQNSLRQPHQSPAPVRNASLLVAHAQPSMRHFIGAEQHHRPRPRELARQEHLKSGGLRADLSEKEIDGATEGDELYSTFVDPVRFAV